MSDVQAVKNFRIIKPVLLFLAGAIIVFLCAFGFSLYWTAQQQAVDSIEQARTRFGSLFFASVQKESLQIEELLTAIAREERLWNLFLAADREGVLAAAAPINQRIKTHLGITHFYFHDPNGVNFLRVHQPARYGDQIDRFTFLQARKTGNTASGIELGPLGTLTLRVVIPWRTNNRLLGYLEMGKEISVILGSLNVPMDMDYFVFLDKSFLDQKSWVEGMTALGRETAWEHYADHVLVGSSSNKRPFDLEAFVNDKLLHAVDVSLGTSSLGDKEQAYSPHLFVIPLPDVRGQFVGHLIGLVDSRALRAPIMAHLGNVVLACILVGVFLMVVFYKFLQRVERNLLKAQQALHASQLQLSAQKLDESRERIFFQSAMRQLLELALLPIEIEVLLERFLEMMISIPWLSVEAKGAVFLLDDASGELVLMANSNLSPELLVACSRIPLGHCLCGRVGQTREFLSVGTLDEQHDIRFPGILQHGHYVVPILAGDHLLGVMTFYLEEGHLYNLNDETFLMAAAHTLSGILQRKRAEQALAKVSRQHQLLLETVGDGIFGLDLTGQLVFMNPAGEKMLGWSVDELIGQDFCVMIPHFTEEDLPLAKEKHPSIVVMQAQFENLSTDVMMLNRSGTRLLVALTATPIVENGVIQGAVTVFRDRTEQRMVAKKKERDYLLRSTISSMIQAAIKPIDFKEQLLVALDFITDIPWLTFESKGAIFLKDLTTGELVLTVHKNLADVLLTKCARVHEGQCLCGQAMASRQIVFAPSVDHCHETSYAGMTPHGHYCVPLMADGTLHGVLTLYVQAGHVPNDEEVLFLQTTATIITGWIEKNRINETLQSAKELAESANKAKGEFLAVMSHEIRTPMNGVLGLTELLLTTELSTQQRLWVENINRSGETLLSLINNILDFSKIDAGRVELELVDFDLHRLVNDLVEMFRKLAQEKGLTVQVGLSEQLPQMVCGDLHYIRQVLTNLLSNAVKFTIKGGVQVFVDGQFVDPERILLHFQIQDTGIGITEEQLSRLFGLFTQADSSTTRKFGGTGLGLAISKQLAQQMGGKIVATSEFGQGSLFSFHLPLNISLETRIVEPLQAPLVQQIAPFSDKTRLLLVEDDSINLLVIEGMLKSYGLKAEVARNGLEALDHFRRARYDLIFMDIQMPQMDGFTVCREIRRLEKELGVLRTPVVALTAYTKQEDQERCFASGMDDYISKPIRKKVLNAALGRWLGGAVIAQEESKPATEPDALIQATMADFDDQVLETFRQSLSQIPGGFERIVKQFLEDAPTELAMMRTGIQLQDFQQVRFPAHTLKSQTAMVGAMALSKLLAQLDELAVSKNLQGANGLFVEVEKLFEVVLIKLNAALERSSQG